MNISVTLLPEAKADIENGYGWYEDQCLGLGMDFLRCVEASLLSIQRTPLIYPVLYKNYRRALVRRFPYAIFFEFDDSTPACLIYAVFHCSKDPSKWMK